MRIVLAGATGLIGGHCLKLLLDSQKVQEVNVLTRRPLDLTHSKLKVHLTDFSDLNQIPHPKNKADAVLCCLGSTIKQAGSRIAFKRVDLDHVVAVARFGLRHEAKKFQVVSSMGADEKSLIFYSRIKGIMEAEVSKLPYDSIDIFRPSMLLGKREKPRTGEEISGKMMKLIQPIMRGPLRKYQPIEAQVVAKVMVKNLNIDSNKGLKIWLSDEIQDNLNA